MGKKMTRNYLFGLITRDLAETNWLAQLLLLLLFIIRNVRWSKMQVLSGSVESVDGPANLRGGGNGEDGMILTNGNTKTRWKMI